jgi:hypothetical protein
MIVLFEVYFFVFLLGSRTLILIDDEKHEYQTNTAEDNRSNGSAVNQHANINKFSSTEKYF